MKVKRCFVSIDLPRRVINEIVKIQKQIWRKNLFVGRVTEPENLHLTLKFLGEIDENKINEVKKLLNGIKFESFESKLGSGRQVQAELGKIGIFSKKIVRIVWVDLKGVFGLQKQIDSCLSSLFEPENRFMSHVTIARVKHVHNKKEFVKYLESVSPEKIKFSINEFYLMESELNREGPVYRDIEKYDLI